jgi:hypothetical protein
MRAFFRFRGRSGEPTMACRARRRCAEPRAFAGYVAPGTSAPQRPLRSRSSTDPGMQLPIWLANIFLIRPPATSAE